MQAVHDFLVHAEQLQEEALISVHSQEQHGGGKEWTSEDSLQGTRFVTMIQLDFVSQLFTTAIHAPVQVTTDGVLKSTVSLFVELHHCACALRDSTMNKSLRKCFAQTVQSKFCDYLHHHLTPASDIPIGKHTNIWFYR